MAQYKLILVNNSTEPGNLIIYQTLGNTPTSDTLAWFSKYAYPGTQISFQWDSTDFDFVWSGGGQIVPGMVFEASQVVPANLQTSNEITFSYDSANQVFFFKDQQQGQPNLFTIREDATLPANAAAVGIGMSGKASFAVQAQPNMTVAINVNNLEYWVTFGTVQQGEFFEIAQLLDPVQIQFPVNVNSLTVTLNPDNTWSIHENVMVAAPLEVESDGDSADGEGNGDTASSES